jgi:hypothetical protein
MNYGHSVLLLHFQAAAIKKKKKKKEKRSKKRSSEVLDEGTDANGSSSGPLLVQFPVLAVNTPLLECFILSALAQLS